MREFSKGEIRKMVLLKKKNFSNGEISKVLHIKHSRVTDFLEDEKNVKKNIGVKKSDRKRGNDPNGNDDTNGDKQNSNNDSDPIREPSESLGVGNGSIENEQINFIGGNGNMPKDTEGDITEKTYYKCFNCGFQSETVFSECPKCDKENNF